MTPLETIVNDQGVTLEIKGQEWQIKKPIEVHDQVLHTDLKPNEVAAYLNSTDRPTSYVTVLTVHAVGRVLLVHSYIKSDTGVWSLQRINVVITNT